MKAVFVLTTITFALPLSAQVRTTGTAPATTGLNPSTTGVTPGTTGLTPGTTGTAPTTSGAGLNTAGSDVVPATGAPTIAGPAGAGTVNVGPAGAGTPVGNTFSRPILTPPFTPGMNPTLNSPTAALDFPQANTTIQPLVTNTGIGGFTSDSAFSPPEASTFPPGGPISVDNTVGQNFAAPFTNFPPSRALSVDLAPGASVATNAVGTPNGFVPPALAPVPPVPPPPIPMNSVGGPAGAQSGTVGPVGAPPFGPPGTPALPPRNPSARIPRVVR